MEIKLAEHCGFCYGVKRAVEVAETAAREKGSVFTLGPIIHNPQMVDKLKKQGALVADTLQDVTAKTVVIRSHGVGPAVYDKAAQLGLEVVDATCPHVKKAQQEAAALQADGYEVVIIGEKNHPEVKSIWEWTGKQAQILETEAEANAYEPTQKLGIVSQTTFSGEKFEKLRAILAQKCPDLVVRRTICTATDQRQAAAVAVATQVELVLVVGGKNSANTSRLAELCRQSGTTTYHIETAAELEAQWFTGIHTIGVTAGASTPDWIIEEVINKVEEMEKMEQMEQMMQDESVKLSVGMIIEGKVVSVLKDEVFVDIGYKSEGMVRRADLAFPTPENAADVVKNGDLISVSVVALDRDDTPVLLSKVLADKEDAWKRLALARDKAEAIDVKITEVVKGGLVGAFSGVRVFIPASQVSLQYVEDLNSYVGDIVAARPIEVDEEKNKAVLSRRVILQEERRRKEDEVYNKLTVGTTVDGTISRIANFGAFVDLGGVDGLIHISDLSWERVASPDEVVAVGDAVSVMVMKVDKEHKRISLSLKEVQEDPWFNKVAELVPGKIIEGTVTKLTAFGAFVAIGDGLEGLVHLSEMAEQRVAKAEDVVSKGQNVKVKVLAVEEGKKKIALSLKAAQEDLERKEFQGYLGNQDSLHVTLGDKFKDLLKGLK
ncbi:MAG: bifunctional 4-hydroxy-3-methylbut-2-enyl diphosphate reductase/30S ribosomal protein S1 [Sporomusaceae bacterium]|nr:bifunctional 4-hydroxy-3-methylbut-2-enyl diphosphate reductase/30S ribosomal protein S1 [Sporomusaceae bacterium]